MVGHLEVGSLLFMFFVLVIVPSFVSKHTLTSYFLFPISWFVSMSEDGQSEFGFHHVSV